MRIIPLASAVSNGMKLQKETLHNGEIKTQTKFSI